MPETEVMAPVDSADIVETVTEAPEVVAPKWSDGPDTFDEINPFSSDLRFDDAPDKKAAEESKEGDREGEENPEEAGTEAPALKGAREAPKGKSVVLKVNGQEIKASDDAVIVIPVDGEPKEFRIGDLKTDINGREFYARKASEADTKAKLAESKLKDLQPFFEDRKKIDAALQRMTECTEKGDGFGAWLEIVRMQGKDLKTELPKFLQQTDVVRKRWEAMTPSERGALMVKEEAEKKSREAAEKESTVAEENRHLRFENYVAQTLERNGLPRKDLDDLFDGMVANGFKFRSQDPEKIVDEVVEFIPINFRYNRTEEALKDVAPDKLQENGAPYLHRIVKFVRSLEELDNEVFSKEKIEDIIRNDLGVVAKPKVTGSQEKASATALATPKKVAGPNGTPLKKEPKAESQTPNTWDDLEGWQ